MDIQDILKKIESFKKKENADSYAIDLKEINDAEDLFADLYIVSKDVNGELQADELLLSVENPTQDDLAELTNFSKALNEFI